MQKPITLFIFAALLLAMPTFLTSMGGIAGVDPSDPLSKSLSSMQDLLGAISYLMGVGFGLKAALALKEYQEGTSYYEPEPVQTIQSEVKTEVMPDIKPVNLLDMEDKELNNKVAKILQKMLEAEKINSYEEDNETQFLFNSVRNDYLLKIAHNYRSIPVKTRKEKIANKPSANTMAHEQLDLIMEGIVSAENSLLDNENSKMRVMSRFLKEKFDTPEEFMVDTSIFEAKEITLSEKEINA